MCPSEPKAFSAFGSDGAREGAIGHNRDWVRCLKTFAKQKKR